jgi:hypothetical protein
MSETVAELLVGAGRNARDTVRAAQLKRAAGECFASVVGTSAGMEGGVANASPPVSAVAR